MLRTIATFVLGLTLAASAGAQTAPNPVIEHFRVYRAALAQGDLAAADAAATAALAASEARDGDGGRTAVLALNLASLRLERGDRAGALQPAQRAHELATRSNANANAVIAQIVLARSSLSEREPSKEQLLAALNAARPNADLVGEVYLAAADLGRQEFADRRYRESAQAWAIALETVGSAPGDPAVARASILTSEAIALMYQASNRNRVNVQEEEITANVKFLEAMRLLRGAARADQEDRGPLSAATRTYAIAYAWRNALRSRTGAEWPRSADLDARANAEADAEPNAANYCTGRLIASPPPVYSRRDAQYFRVGAAMLAFHIGADGQIIHREIVAVAPTGSDITREIERVYDHWRIEWSDDEPGCAYPAHILRGTQFNMRQL